MKPIIIDPATLAHAAKSALKTTGENYFTGLLSENHLKEIKEFHDQVAQLLKPAEHAWFLEKPQSFFARHFKNGNGNTAIASVTQSGRLIAQAIMLNPSEVHPETGMVDMAPVGAPEELTVLQGVGVLPELRGNGLMHDLVRHWLDHAADLEKTHAIAEIDIHNIASWNVFLKEGLNIVSIGTDPADGTLVYNVHETVNQAIAKRLSPAFNEKAKGGTCMSSLEDIKRQENLFRAGCKCIGYSKAENALVFQKNGPGL